ncbi:MAG: NgoFVII family restriction endonuclease, partial [Thermotogota bacterium]|nr:NgoFVII family restriction endonuclease [Thermotogota bacterium]
FDEVLLNPGMQGCDELFIVAGYATSAMAFHHLEGLRKNNIDARVKLIVGMTPVSGLALSNHRGFQKIVDDDYPESFECSYLISSIAVHSKVYSWFKHSKPYKGFVGSANYTQRAFGKLQREAMGVIDARLGWEYFNNLIDDTIFCNHPEAEDYVSLYNYRKEISDLTGWEDPDIVEPISSKMDELESVKVSFLSNGELPQRSGLNWGQRPEEHREPNQAYIRLTSDIYNTDFFPERGQHFTVLTDDNKVLICTRAQDNGKAIHTPHNNSLIGEYFRNRLGIGFGNPVTIENLKKYGRTDLTFYKLDEETYFMDFSGPTNG